MAEDLSYSFENEDLTTFETSYRDRALFLFQEYDLEAQLLAIKGILQRNRQRDEALAAQIKALEEDIRNSTDEYAYHLLDCWIDRLHGSVFQDAAHSMSAVGMLAPFVESLFVAIFKGLRQNQQSDRQASDARTAAVRNDFWNPHFVFSQKGRRTHIVEGIKQLSSSTGLTAFLPDGHIEMFSALFTYRNRMFHHGFEWPMNERKKFDEMIREEGWPLEWFRKSESGDEPWIFYMSDQFVQHCLTTIDQVLEGVGRYLKRHE